jgi:hypothetical protein
LRCSEACLGKGNSATEEHLNGISYRLSESKSAKRKHSLTYARVKPVSQDPVTKHTLFIATLPFSDNSYYDFFISVAYL